MKQIPHRAQCCKGGYVYTNFEMMFPHNDKCFNGMRYAYGGKEYLYLNDKYLETSVKDKKDKYVVESEISTGLTGYAGYINFALNYHKIQGIYGSQKTLLCRSGMLAMVYVIGLLKSMEYEIFCDRFVYFEISNICRAVFGDDHIIDMHSEAFRAKPHSAYIYGSVIEDGTIYDSEEIAKALHSVGSIAVCDNTFASVFNINPIEQGTDIVVDSMSKYFTGDAGIQSALAVFNEKAKIFIDGLIYPLAQAMGVLAGKRSAEALNNSIDTAKERFITLEKNARVVNRFLREHAITTKFPNMGSAIWITGIDVNCHNAFKFIQPNATFGLSHTTYSVYSSDINDRCRWWLRLSCGLDPPKNYINDLKIIVNSK